jgi:hypothetical protein
MKIYEPIPDSDVYDSLYYINDNDYRIVWHFLEGQHYEQAPTFWQPICVGIEPMAKKGEFPSLSTALVFSDKALKVLMPLIKNSIDLLPLQCNSNHYTIIKVHDVVDCLDYSRAVVRKFPSSGRIMEIISYSFKYECINNKNIFKIPEIKTRVFVSQKFKDFVENNHLEGLIFREVYSEG